MADRTRTVTDSTGLVRKFTGSFNRSDVARANTLGLISASQQQLSGKIRLYRKECLDKFDAYYEGTQYDHLPKWDSLQDKSTADYIPVRKRQPRIKYGFAKVLAKRLAGKLAGTSYPSMNSADLDYVEYQKMILRASRMPFLLMEPIRRMLCSGSGLVRFYMESGSFKIEHFLSKYCYPEFRADGSLESVMVRYVYTDEDDRDERGNPKKKWYQLYLGSEVDILFDNPEYKPDAAPVFQEVAQADHQLGFVQAEWFRTSEEKDDVDGYSLISDVIEIIDEINYSLSQSSQAVGYNQDPQLTLKNMTDDELESLIRSSTKGWNLGKEGEAEFLESNLGGVEAAGNLRDKFRLHLQDITRIILMDPEKMVASAQSGKAMEILHGPMVELIEELRPMIERPILSMQTKMAIMNLRAISFGAPAPVVVPPGWQPKTLDMTYLWPPIFPQTTEDLQKKAALASTLTTANIFSREWATRWLAKDFGVDDVELELQRIAAQPVINPFGGF